MLFKCGTQYIDDLVDLICPYKATYIFIYANPFRTLLI